MWLWVEGRRKERISTYLLLILASNDIVSSSIRKLYDEQKDAAESENYFIPRHHLAILYLLASCDVAVPRLCVSRGEQTGEECTTTPY